ncbi:hypothetical protein B8281_16000 [Cellulosimicrobium sp. TH-20]|nr:hypothetical protein B8281_16000 [Cellulosimicrobium sp. TH-20]
MTKDEAREFVDRVRAVSPHHGSSSRPGPRVREMPATLWTCAAWLTASGLASIPLESVSEPRPGPILHLFLLVFFGGALLLCVVGIREARRWRLRQVPAYLESIGFFGRDAYKWSPPRGTDSDMSKSKRQMQHEWYGDRRGLNWRDRERAETSDLDAETYISNVLEDDKD